MKTKILHINYPSLDAETIGNVTAAIRDEILQSFESNQISFSFSSNKQSGYVMVYPTAPVLSLRVSNHSPQGGDVDKYALQTQGNRVIVNAEAENGQSISESVLYDTLEQIKQQCVEMQNKIYEK